MVKRCAWGTCNGDERYKERLKGAKLISFPTPKKDLGKCQRWIKACGRPHDQLNIHKINKHKSVCSTHFYGGEGPTPDYPDPIPADGSKLRRCRQSSRGNILKNIGNSLETVYTSYEDSTAIASNSSGIKTTVETSVQVQESATQTDDTCSLDMLALTAEVDALTLQVKSQCHEITRLENIIKQQQFRVTSIVEKEKTIKDIFQYYTGITYLRFLSLVAFLCPPNFVMNYEKGRNDLNSLSIEDGLFLTMCRLRHNYGLKDLAIRFNISVRSSSCVFNKWIDHLYLHFGQINIWPNRNSIIENMPRNFKKDYPTTMIIIDATEIKTQVPRSLGLQSQLYSDYKSATTLKALVGCDPNGALMFVSELYTGSISDKALTEKSGFYSVLKNLKDLGWINDGDSVMADKGFTIENELKNIGLNLNIPPFTTKGAQMSVFDTMVTQKIAKHRIHIERLISRIKLYSIISHKIPTSLFQNINKIWTICCFLTLCQGGYLPKE